MLQQLAFARALLGNPALLLLDEPTRSLDPGAIERLWRALERRPHAAVMLATHNRDDLEHCDERVELPT
jgi:ABC-type multidrug transport system ATPase subunit